ncbi:hypothetical protein I6N90_08220 [Paenibacillus sp. GSMTC-2017]|uniref:hypothetical protein n=1 Tax=Paenibacillus sp. GSMTC-2017 TaxID=2794350 RepID=UPI0018D9D36D|nr:hypothetical protein [Paenibacillus sp. GSMTC-2017]MBH5317788.1 hypothetical protein [Paenibacillus sp. GSMTC-2017]
MNESKHNAVVVAESILGKKLPEDVLENANKKFQEYSAGMMITLELIQQFGEEDLLKGYRICGTGTIDTDGNIGRIGGLKMKLIASDKLHEKKEERKFNYFFVPKVQFPTAIKIAETEGLEIDIVPIENISEALEFLNNLVPKPWLINEE